MVDSNKVLLYFNWVINMGFERSIIGKRIKRSREEVGLTQERFAEIIGVSSAYISKIERGKTPISLDRLSEFCKVLETEPEYIISGANTESSDFLQNEIIDLLQGCSPEKIKLITQVIKPIVEYKEIK
jgi:transcriptional regulator with XRE-family HTH domain